MTERPWEQAREARELAIGIMVELTRIGRLATPVTDDARLILAQTETGMDRILEDLREARDDLAAVAQGRSIGGRPGRGREAGDMLGLARSSEGGAS